MSKPRDYAALLRELRSYRTDFDARSGFVLDPRKLTRAKKAAITRAHGALRKVLLEPHVVYKSADKRKLEAVKRAAGMVDPDKYRVGIVLTPIPELTEVKVGRGKAPTVKVVLKEAKPKGRKPVELVLESRDWDPQRIALDTEGELRRLTRGDKPSTKYLMKAGQRIQWRMGYPEGREALVQYVTQILLPSSAGTPEALATWSTGLWAFKGSEADFKRVLSRFRETRDVMRGVRRRAKRLSKRERMRGRR